MFWLAEYLILNYRLMHFDGYDMTRSFKNNKAIKSPKLSTYKENIAWHNKQ